MVEVVKWMKLLRCVCVCEVESELDSIRKEEVVVLSESYVQSNLKRVSGQRYWGRVRFLGLWS